MTSKEDIEKLRKDIEMDMLDDSSLAIYDSIIVDLESFQKTAKKNPRELKRFKIDLQPMKSKCNTHYTNHLVNYISFNIKSWANWDRLPITITDTTTNKQLTIHANEWIKWKEMVYEWLGIPKEVLEVI